MLNAKELGKVGVLAWVSGPCSKKERIVIRIPRMTLRRFLWSRGTTIESVRDAL